MDGGIYKKGQGHYTRLVSAIAYGALILMGAVWIWDLLETQSIGTIEKAYVQMTGVIIFVAIFGSLGYYVIGRQRRSVDFMIATEGELKKVHWSTRREIIGSTWVVIGLTLFIAVFCFVADQAFVLLFRSMGVLEPIG